MQTANLLHTITFGVQDYTAHCGARLTMQQLHVIEEQFAKMARDYYRHDRPPFGGFIRAAIGNLYASRVSPAGRPTLFADLKQLGDETLRRADEIIAKVCPNLVEQGVTNLRTEMLLKFFSGTKFRTPCHTAAIMNGTYNHLAHGADSAWTRQRQERGMQQSSLTAKKQPETPEQRKLRLEKERLVRAALTNCR